MDIHRDNIILADFGENKGCVQSGIRPAVVIQNDLGNKHSTTTIVAPITGKIKKVLPTHHEIYTDDYDCLKCDSTILAEQVVTISKEQILHVIGHLRKTDSNKLNEILLISLNMNENSIREDSGGLKICR